MTNMMDANHIWMFRLQHYKADWLIDLIFLLHYLNIQFSCMWCRLCCNKNIIYKFFMQQRYMRWCKRNKNLHIYWITHKFIRHVYVHNFLSYFSMFQWFLIHLFFFLYHEPIRKYYFKHVIYVYVVYLYE